MSDPGSFVNQRLQTSVPWGDLVSQGNLQTVIHAIVQRLDRQDSAIAAAATPFVHGRLDLRRNVIFLIEKSLFRYFSHRAALRVQVMRPV
jgi:hypothetical protein